MKKSILIISAMVIFLLVMVPNITAIEYKTIEETYIEKIRNVDINELS